MGNLAASLESADRSQSAPPLAKFGAVVAVVAMAVSFALCITLPGAIGFDNALAIRYLPVALIVFSTLSLWLGGAAPKRLFSWPMLAGLALCIIEILGSLYYIVYLHGDSTGSFFGRGMVIIAMLPGAMIGFSPALRRPAARTIVQVVVPLSFIGSAMLFLHTFHLILNDYDQILHEQIVILISGPAYIILRRRSTLAAVFLIVLLTSYGFLTGKSTAYILVLFFAIVYFYSVGMVFLTRILRKETAQKRAAMLVTLAPILIGIVLAVVAVFAAVVDERSNRYSFDPRRLSYALRWEQFQNSPIFGKLFAMSANVSTTVGFGKDIPSHNDILDILAAGGLICFALYVMCVVPAIFNRFALTQLMAHGKRCPPEFYFWCLVIFYIAGATGNPMLIQPKMAVPIWFCIGFMLGFVRALALMAPTPAPARHKSPVIANRRALR